MCCICINYVWFMGENSELVVSNSVFQPQDMSLPTKVIIIIDFAKEAFYFRAGGKYVPKIQGRFPPTITSVDIGVTLNSPEQTIHVSCQCIPRKLLTQK
jgi:hypothetical protein